MNSRSPFSSTKATESKSTPEPESTASVSVKPESLNRLYQLKSRLQARHKLTACIRDFFSARDFLEVDTPVRIAAPALEDHIDAEPSGTMFLRTSPELHMKRLLAAGYPRLFQLGPCFRAGEKGRRHLSEFTMLEWYRAHEDYQSILRDTVDLVKRAAHALCGSHALSCRSVTINVAQEWEALTVDQAFERYAGSSVDAAVAENRFEEILVDSVEPHLGRTRPTVLFDFPSQLGSLARTKPDNHRRVERWELYIAGVELANAYNELTDAGEQEHRFIESAALRRRTGRGVYPLDNEYMACLRGGHLPECSGIALGVDRLLMILTDAESIADVVPFTEA
ncbi:MAG: EF-P lysine aminoacylase GenX [Candidatus Pacebacteria bacterium]|nr:EF-P lysine aminoacylase GenX [Candidatus Paceibacterota bacterium]